MRATDCFDVSLQLLPYSFFRPLHGVLICFGKSLVRLNLSGNYLTDYAVKEWLIPVLKSCTNLKYLDVSSNELTSSCLEQLGCVLRGKSLHELSLSYNCFSDCFSQSISTLLIGLTSLVSLGLKACSLPSDLFDDLGLLEALKGLTCLENLDISSNQLSLPSVMDIFFRRSIRRLDLSSNVFPCSLILTPSIAHSLGKIILCNCSLTDHIFSSFYEYC
ncbi:uncharacterized protein LOC115232109 [Octopus sinensis]|uniref:Uncharacterized protein LOC115232109 n=1 Tax=Octopus sinensis TaxID=2607531 RepID=A0A6P7U1K9_9MOLL|nr:uncharacterized protein LOC115232109 [Octopus sinensis]